MLLNRKISFDIAKNNDISRVLIGKFNKYELKIEKMLKLSNYLLNNKKDKK